MRAGAWVLALVLGWSAGTAGAETGTERLARQVVAAQPALAGPLLEARVACGAADRLCLARHLARHAPTLARLTPAPHQDTDTIRWAATRPSVRLAGSTITIDGFGRKVRPELAAALALLDEERPFTVDLRANGGGDIERMRQAAELLTATAGLAIETVCTDGGHMREPLRPKATRFQVERVIIGPGTASAGLLLAALLQAQGAVVEGGDPGMRTVMSKAVLSVDHDWRLVVATGRSRIVRRDL